MPAPQPQDGYSRELADHPDIFRRIGVTLLGVSPATGMAATSDRRGRRHRDL